MNKSCDHDHAKERDNFRGAAHAHCNSSIQENQFKITIFAHNGLDYDFHFVFRQIAKTFLFTRLK